MASEVMPALQAAASAGLPEAAAALAALQAEDALSQHQAQVAEALGLLAAGSGDGASLAEELRGALTLEVVRERLVAAVEDRVPDTGAGPDSHGEIDLF